MRLAVLVTSLFLSTVALGATPATDAMAPEPTNLPAEDLGRALQTLAKQRGFQFVYRADLVRGVKTHGAHGYLTIEEALTQLLQGTGLTYGYLAERAVTIIPLGSSGGSEPQRGSASPHHQPGKIESGQETSSSSLSDPSFVAQTDNGSVPASGARSGKPGRLRKAEEESRLQEVIVTGTLISGTSPIGSPLMVYSRADIEQTGAATIGDFARQLPENFSGLDNITSGNGAPVATPVFNQGSQNGYGGSAFDLHGLGPIATLTLLNGHRLAPAGFDGSFVDVSLIPLSAVNRMEILPDGASAIYGTDAVAGVVNIITRRHFSGAETGVQYGESTDGGAGHLTGSQLVGTSWSEGNLMLAYEYDRQSALDASQRSFIPNLGGPFSIVPATWRNSLLLSGSQAIGDGTSISGDAIYSTKNYHSTFTIVPTMAQKLLENYRVHTTVSGANLTLNQSLAGGWTVALTGSYSRMQQSNSYLDTFGPVEYIGRDDDVTTLTGIDLLASGTIVQLPGGGAKGAIGASYQGQTYVNGAWITGAVNLVEPVLSFRRHEESVYGELVLPLVGGPSARAWARKVNLSVASRYDRYSDFGSTLNPKVGIVWSPYGGLDVRASYGRSYRAPLLSEIDAPVAYITQPFPDPSSPAGFTDTLYINGGNRALGPESSRSFTAGFDYRKSGLSVSTTYFHVNYQNRIGTPPIANFLAVLFDPVDAPYVTRNPSAAFVDAAFNSPGFQADYVGLGPAGVKAVFDNRYTNLASSSLSGIDVDLRYQLATDSGTFTPTVAAERQIRNELRTTPTSSAIELLDLYGEPVRWKVRGGLAWMRGGYGAALNVNYMNSYRDLFTTPPSRIGSWTTIDLHLSYRVPEGLGFSAMSGLTVALTVQNLMDERPPYVAIPQTVANGEATLPYDPENASPVGRFISLQVNKRWIP